MTLCRERYEGSDGMRHSCQRPKGHAHGHDAYPLSLGYYCNLHHCTPEQRAEHTGREVAR